MAFATTQARNIIPEIISTYDPNQKTNFDVSDTLFALTAGLPLAGQPEAGNVASAATRAASQALFNGLQDSPNVIRAIWPAGKPDSEVVQIGSLSDRLSSSSSSIQKSINAGCQLLMSDVPSFVNFASAGGFSGADTHSIGGQAQGLDLGLKTYILSKAMGQTLSARIFDLGPTGTKSVRFLAGNSRLI